MRPRRIRRPRLWGLLCLSAVIRRMERLSRAGRDRDVLQAGEWYLRRWKGNARFYAAMVDAHWGLSHWREAVQFGRRTLALDPGHVVTVKFMLSAYRSCARARGAAFGEAWLTRHGIEADVCRHLSILHDDLGRPADALAVARRGLARSPQNRRLAACAANYLAKVEGAASALRFAEQHRALLAGDPYCGNTVADGLVAISAFAEAAQVREEMHARHPADASVFASLLEAWFSCGRFGAIIAAVERWQHEHPLTARIANEAGRAGLELERFEEALAWFKRAMELDPDSAKFADNHAIALGRAGRYAESIAAAQQRLAAPGAPDRRRLLRSLAVNHTSLGRHTEALPYYQQVFAEFPDDARAVGEVLVGLNWLKRYGEAAAFGAAQRSARGAQLPRDFWSEYAWALHQSGRFADQLEVAREWHLRYPDDAVVVRVINRALNALERRTEALGFARYWIGRHSESAWGWRYLAEQYGACDQPLAELAALTEACRLRPDDPDLADVRVSSLRRLQRSREALEYGRNWIEQHPRRVTATLRNRVGLAADDLRQWSIAEDCYRQAHLAEPDHGTWLGNLLRALTMQDRAGEAVAIGQPWLDSHPWNGYVAGKLAWALHEAKQLAAETDLLRRYIAAEPGDVSMHHPLLTSLVAQKRTPEAEAWIEQCVADGSITSGMWNDLANHLRDGGRVAEAEAAYRRGLALKPDNGTVAGNLASLLVETGRAPEARELCVTWLQQHPDHPHVRRHLANACYEGDDYEMAEREYRALVAREPDSVFVFERWIASLRLTGCMDEVVTETQRWLETPGHAPTAFLLIELGIANTRLNRPDAALANYDAALALHPGACAAASRKMRLLADQHRLDRALDFGEPWLAAYPENADADFRNELGILQDRAGRTAAAERSFLQALERAPANAVFAGNAVEIIARRGAVEESIRLGQRFLANQPPTAYLLRRLAEAYAAHHEHDTALDLLTSADALEPNDPDLARDFLRFAADAREFTRGVEFGRAWVARPGNDRRATIWAWLARLCFRADFDDEALSALRRAEELDPDEIVHVRQRFSFRHSLGDHRTLVREYDELRPDWREDGYLMRQASRAWHELGMEAEALEVATRNLAVNPADEDACAWLAELQARCGQRESALAGIAAWMAVHGEQPAVLKVRAALALRDDHCAAALADAEKVLALDDSDEEAFVLAMRALHGLSRRAEAKGRLLHWVEHHGSSPRIERLLDENTQSDAA